MFLGGVPSKQTTWSTRSKRSNQGGRGSPLLSPERSRNSRWLLLADFGLEAAPVELERDGVADLDLGGVPEDGAGGVGGDGVAAFEDSQRASLFELQGQARQALALGPKQAFGANAEIGRDRKSTRLNSSHQIISYAVFCLKKKKTPEHHRQHTPKPPPHT